MNIDLLLQKPAESITWLLMLLTFGTIYWLLNKWASALRGEIKKIAQQQPVEIQSADPPVKQSSLKVIETRVQNLEQRLMTIDRELSSNHKDILEKLALIERSIGRLESRHLP